MTGQPAMTTTLSSCTYLARSERNVAFLIPHYRSYDYRTPVHPCGHEGDTDPSLDPSSLNDVSPHGRFTMCRVVTSL